LSWRGSEPIKLATQCRLDILRLRNDLYCVEWGVKLYSLTRLDIASSKEQPAPLNRRQPVCQQSCSPAHCYAELAISFPNVEETISNTHCTYPRMDGQAEWATNDEYRNGRPYSLCTYIYVLFSMYFYIASCNFVWTCCCGSLLSNNYCIL